MVGLLVGKLVGSWERWLVVGKDGLWVGNVVGVCRFMPTPPSTPPHFLYLTMVTLNSPFLFFLIYFFIIMCYDFNNLIINCVWFHRARHFFLCWFLYLVMLIHDVVKMYEC